MSEKQPPQPLEGPSGFIISPEAQELGTKLGNIALALDLLAVEEGLLGTEPDKALDLLEVSKSLETAALKRYVKLVKTIGRRLADAQAEYEQHRKRSGLLFEAVVSDATGRV